MYNVFLRYSRGNEFPIASSCLTKWLDVFKHYPITILCDDGTLDEKHYFQDIRSVRERYKVIGTKYISCPEGYGDDNILRGHTTSVFQAYLSSQTEYFWLIDADDTIFHHSNDWIRERLKRVEERVGDYDGLSLDFYRHTQHIQQWSLGVALLKTMPIDIFYTVPWADALKANPHQVTPNIDAIMDTLRIQGRLKLESFFFDDSYFTHIKFHTYYWKDGCLWGRNVKPGILSL